MLSHESKDKHMKFELFANNSMGRRDWADGILANKWVKLTMQRHFVEYTKQCYKLVK